MNKRFALTILATMAITATGFAKTLKSDQISQKMLKCQQIRTEFKATPEKAGGIYYAYPYSTDSMAPAPSGYEPFYISHYGRHGSRWVINKKLHRLVADALRAEQSQGNLTDTGREVLDKVEKLGKHTEGHWGELTPLGERQHSGIADRMAKRFPGLFKGNAIIIARSSTEPRCIISMAAFTEGLQKNNPNLTIERHASPGDMKFIMRHNDETRMLEKKDADWRKRFASAKDSLTRSVTTASRLFTDPGKVKDLPGLMRYIYDVAIDVQDVDGIDEDILGVFDPEDLYNQWKCSNYQMYVCHANSPDGTGAGPRSATNLLNDIIDRADEAIAGKRPTAADLRFGHDTALLRLLALMGAEGADASVSGFEKATCVWQKQNLTPMGANLQLILLRNSAGDILAAPRLNERPLRINGVTEAAPGYYRWNDLRRIWKSTCNPVASLLERVCPGSSRRFIFEQTDTPDEFFEISAENGKPVIKGNSAVNIASGLNWYLKYYTGIHLSWNMMTADLPDVLPLPSRPERHVTDAAQRYYLNYCTHSYSMAFWDWERWQKEIDWMALHGINMPLAITGTDVVWRNTLLRLGYSKKEADEFVAGPAFQAWWLMNNLEGWGGPNSEKWYEDRSELQDKILTRMRELGMEPVLPGYSGMVPHDAEERLGMDVSGKGIWNGFVRPTFLKSTDPQFNKIADIYYDELRKVSGVAKYYSMDPFHEGGSIEGVDLTEAGKIIAGAMKRANPEAVWVIQGWNENPRAKLYAGIPKGDIVVLDLASEIKPQWGDPDTPSKTPRPTGYDGQDWLWCMLLNFGGNVGLHGRLDNVIGGYYKARDSRFGKDMTGIGLTPEGIENNPVMYELVSELIWRPEQFTKENWLEGYSRARYGSKNANAEKAWKMLGATIYNCPWGILQQGTTESIFCARPSEKAWKVSSWSRMKPYYKPEDVIAAAKKFAAAAPALKGNENYRYDLVDITRQAIAEKGRIVYTEMQKALKSKDMETFRRKSDSFLSLIKLQDELLSTRPEFSVSTWIDDARRLAPTKHERDNFENNARLLITTWGPRVASEDGGLRDYGHREWSGVLGTLYYERWKTWIERKLSGDKTPIDFYSIDEKWVNSREKYPLSGADCVETALKALKAL